MVEYVYDQRGVEEGGTRRAKIFIFKAYYSKYQYRNKLL